MIEQLMVKDYILFSDAQIDFKSGMSVITGETGAGKSLLIDAIQAISGGRVSRDVVRKGKEKAVLQMVLSDLPSAVAAMLEENGFDVEDNLVITRIVSQNGKSRMLVNGRTSTNAFVASLVARMVDIHSQLDTITLMDPDLQLELLDRFARVDDLKEQIARAYASWSATARKIRKLQQETFSDAHLEKITRQMNEIEAAKVRAGELEELEEKIRKADDASTTMEDLSSALYFWKKEQGVQEMLYQAARGLENHESTAAVGARLMEMYYEGRDLFDQLDDIKSELAEGAENLDAMQSREHIIQTLYKKYGGSYEALQESYQSLGEQVDRILHRQDLFDQLEKEKKEQQKVYTALASKLHQERKKVVADLKARIEEHARDLMLEHCVFEIHFERKNPSVNGMDAVEFRASMNPGQAPTSLKTSASGGELSRLMLALKVVFQAENGIGTLVFDEIDTGVSGKVALAMGSKMHALAENYQVLCITHLPSVAVWADDHFRVAKSADHDVTTTSVSLLNDRQHVEELSIMASGTADEMGVASMEELVARVRHG